MAIKLVQQAESQAQHDAEILSIHIEQRGNRYYTTKQNGKLSPISAREAKNILAAQYGIRTRLSKTENVTNTQNDAQVAIPSYKNMPLLLAAPVQPMQAQEIPSFDVVVKAQQTLLNTPVFAFDVLTTQPREFEIDTVELPEIPFHERILDVAEFNARYGKYTEIVIDDESGVIVDDHQFDDLVESLAHRALPMQLQPMQQQQAQAYTDKYDSQAILNRMRDYLDRRQIDYGWLSHINGQFFLEHDGRDVLLGNSQTCYEKLIEYIKTIPQQPTPYQQQQAQG